MESNFRSPVEQLAALASKAVMNRTKLAADGRNATFVCGGSVTSSQPILIHSGGHTAGTGIPLKVLRQFLNSLQKTFFLEVVFQGVPLSMCIRLLSAQTQSTIFAECRRS